MATATHDDLAARPSHVPDSLVFDFDFMRGADYLGDPYAYASEVTQKAPHVFWTPRNRGHWVITSFDLVHKATRDWEMFSSQIIPKEVAEAMIANLPEGSASPLNSLPANMDPPEHSAYREPISAAFSPRLANSVKEDIRSLAAELIEDMKPKGGCELISEVTEILPVRMFLKLFGLPLEKAGEYRAVVKSVSGNTSMQDFEGIVRNTTILVNTFTEDVVARRDNPGDDILSRLWRMEILGEPMTLETMQRFCMSLFLAGLETVTSAMALGTRHLALHPELQERLRADPSLIPVATEEFLRLYGISLPIRTVAKDCQFAGVTMRKGEQVHLFSAAANRDSGGFEDPETFSLERPVINHLSFGGGQHRCLGMHLARVELHVYYEELLKRMPPFRLDPDRPTTYYGGISMGPREVHILWD